MSQNSGQILIVEDEVNIRAGLHDVLAKDGHHLLDVGSGEEAIDTLAATECDVAVVDIRMPGMTGIELLEVIRERWPHMAVIILTGHGDLESAMAAVRAGAQDYLLKPAQPDTIRDTVLKALAVARRRKERARLLESLRSGLGRLDGLGSEDQVNEQRVAAPVRVMKVGVLEIDPQAHEVRKEGESVHLSPTEFKLLSTLAARPDEVIDYLSLSRLSLGYDAEIWEAKELLKRHVFAIRQKIEPDPASPRYLMNVRGVGYRLTTSD